MAFPTIATILDNFNRANANISGSTSSGDGTWSTTQIQSASANALKIVSNQLTPTAASNNGLLSTSYGPDTEVYCTLVAIPSSYVALFSRLTGTGASTYNGYFLIASVVAGTNNDTWVIKRVNAGVATTLATFTGPDMAAGDQIGYEVLGTGATVTINVYRKASGGSWTLVGTFADTSASRLVAAGTIGVELGATAVIIDDLSGGTSSSVTTFSKTGGGISAGLTGTSNKALARVKTGGGISAGVTGTTKVLSYLKTGGGISKPHLIVTNYIPNGGGEVDFVGWVNNAGSETVSQDTTTSFNGAASIKCICPGTIAAEGLLIFSTAASAVGGGLVTLQARVKATAGTALRLELTFRTSGNSSVGGTAVTFFTADGTWQFVTVTGVLINPSIDRFSLKVRINGTAAAVINVDAAQGEVGVGSPNTYVDTTGAAASKTFVIGGPGATRSTTVGKQGGGVSSSVGGATRGLQYVKIGGSISMAITGAIKNLGINKIGGGVSVGISGTSKTVTVIKVGGGISSLSTGTSKFLITSKIGGAVALGLSGGVKSVINSKTGGGVSVSNTGAIKRSSVVKTGGGISNLTVGATKTISNNKTGGGVVTSVAGGRWFVSFEKSGGAFSSLVSGAIKVVSMGSGVDEFLLSVILDSGQVYTTKEETPTLLDAAIDQPLVRSERLETPELLKTRIR